MKTRHHLVYVLVIAAILVGACNMPTGPAAAPTSSPVSEQAIYTAAAETLAAQLTAAAPAQPEAAPTEAPPAEAPPTLAPVEAATRTPELPTSTPTLAFTDTPAFTATPELPMISASVATNCRKGPNKAYEPPVGVLNVNQTAQVHGRNTGGTWWYIANPNRNGEFCWVWGETTTVTGNTSNLPVITPPPLPPTATSTVTPGANYTASYETVHACGGTPTAIFEINNKGGQLHSLSLKIEDLTAGVTLYGPASSDAPFMGAPGECPPGGDVLPAGKTLYIGGAIGAGGSGHSARATIRLCTANGLGGVCVDKTVEFTIP